MGDVRFLAVAFATVMAGAAIVAPPAQAGQATASTPLATLALTVDDATFEVTGCLDIPAVAVVSGAGADVSWNLELKARLEGTAPSNSEFLYGTGNDRQEEEFLICSFEGAGRWIVSGTFTTRDYERDLEFETTLETSFTLSKAPTKTAIARVRSTATTVVITGRVTSDSSTYGVVGAPGEVVVQVRPASRGKWIDVGSAYAGSTGIFSVTSYKTYPKGSSYRARYVGSDSTAASSSPVARS